MNRGVTRSARRQAKCAHIVTVTVRSHRIERRICEDCAYVSFRATEEEPEYGRRGNLARRTNRELELIAG